MKTFSSQFSIKEQDIKSANPFTQKQNKKNKKQTKKCSVPSSFEISEIE